ncbi:NDR1/HIN1-like protein 1 [Lolium perenne]|uniref:NDR1/HIN1-like protein 1 n=1 Tax=Lolium perenne TaxID=4522 RepID=UPI0021F663E0|nr:NDR1/HIN1-like protein 12 [Lolium perenne]
MATSKRYQCEFHRGRGGSHLLLAAYLLAAAAATAVLLALALFIVYRPIKPQASVARAAVYRLSISSGTVAGGGNNNASAAPPPLPNAVCASLQFTLLLHNPSNRAAVLYDGLVAFASYRGEAVTPPARLPPVVQERGADVALSPVLGGDALMPISADAVRALAAGGAARRVRLRLVVVGRVRYRAGPFRSGWRDLYVRCDTVVGLGVDAAAGGSGAGDVPLLEYPRCAVDA